MDPKFQEALGRGIEAFALAVDAEARGLLERYVERLLVWNRKVNLTRITGPEEMAEKHVVDSLLVLPSIAEMRSLLDIGAGPGVPGVPLACARRDLEVTCCDSAGKKVAFVKAVAAELGLRVRGVAVRAGGNPDAEGLPRAEAVVSRALADPGKWVPLGARYVAEGGVLLAMLGRGVDRVGLEEIGRAVGLTLVAVEEYELPISRAARAIARWRRA